MSPREALRFLRDPRSALTAMGIELPRDCRIETVVENHDWISKQTGGFARSNGTIVCNVGGGDVAKNFYRVSMYGHKNEDVGKHRKKLLHSPDVQQRK